MNEALTAVVADHRDARVSMMKPVLFSMLPFAEASAKAEREQRLLLIDFTAEWCAPCKNMDRNTWVDPAVVGWVAQNAVAVQVDVDVEKELAERFSVRAMPTMVLMRGEELLDRVTGARSAAKLVQWFESVRQGRREIDALREAAAAPDPSARLQLARQLMTEQQFAEASELLVELWRHGAEWNPAWVGVRLSFLLGEVQVLVSHWAPARTAFETLRDELRPHFPEQDAVVDWLALNETLGADQASLAWFDSVKTQPPEWLEHEHRVRELLVRHERWGDLGSLIIEPLEHIERARELMNLMVEDLEEGERRAHLLEYSRERFREEVSVVIRAMRAAARHADAEAVQLDARKHDPSEEMRDASA